MNVGVLDGLPGGRAAVDADVHPGDVGVTGKLAAQPSPERKDIEPLLGGFASRPT